MAFTLTWPQVVKLGPDLASLSSDSQNEVLANVDARLSELYLGSKYPLACLYLALHFGALVKRGAAGSAGALTSESVGSVSASYAAMMTSAALDSTPWGAQYRELLRESQYRLGVVL